MSDNIKLRAWVRRSMVIVSLVLGTAALAAAGTVTGVVRNGTTGKPAAGVDVILIQLQGGMQSIANTKTDASGHYMLDNPAIGQGPMLIRAVYRGVMFHQPLTPGMTTADVTIYDPSSDAKTIQVGSRLIIFQPNNANLIVGEEYSLQNESKPPVAYFKEQGDFDFAIPQGASLSEVSSWGPSGMPVVQGTIDRGNQRYAIAYAFQPGDNGVRFSYQVPYASSHANLEIESPYATQRVMLVAPHSVQVSSPGFTPAGNQQGFDLYTRDDVPAGASFDVSVSGTAPPPDTQQSQSQGAEQGAGQSAGQGAEQGAEQGSGDQVNGRDSIAIQAMPNRLEAIRWIVIGGFAALLALGVLILWRTPVAALTEGVTTSPLPAKRSLPSGQRSGTRNGHKQSAAAASGTKTESSVRTPPSVPAASPSNISSNSPSNIERQVEQGLDELRDKLFRLELRRQAGTISEEDYARERSRTEQILRELVRG